jgi:metal-sulfur cluster biosynthetic enzyme
VSVTAVEDRLLEALHRVIDPELGIDVVDLGLVYGLESADGEARLVLGMTTPSCPFASTLARRAEAEMLAVEGVTSARVRLVADPPWHPDRMSDRARRALGWR